MGLRGDLSTIKRFNAHLRQLPLSVAHDVAQRAAPELTRLAREAHAARRGVYGDAYPASKLTGEQLDLEVTGDTARDLTFVANGTIVRAVLGTRYAKYLIGKYGILPNGRIPVEWSTRLAELVNEAAAQGGAP